MVVANSFQKVNRHIICGLLVVAFTVLCGGFAAARAPVYVTEVADSGELMLGDGRQVRLAHLVLVEGAVDFIRRETTDALYNLQVEFRDRHGRAHVLLLKPEGGSLQQDLLQAGLAVLYTEDIDADLGALKAAEQSHAWPVLQAGEKIEAGFAVVEGVVVDVALYRQQAYINFGNDWKTDFTIFIPPDTLKRFDREMLEALEGKVIRVRGMVHDYYGPRITLFHPQMMESHNAQ